MCVLKKDSSVSLRLQHPVPVERIVRLQGAFEILKKHQEKTFIVQIKMKNRYRFSENKDSKAEQQFTCTISALIATISAVSSGFSISFVAVETAKIT